MPASEDRPAVFSLVALSIFFLLAAGAGCTKNTVAPHLFLNNCTACHTDAAMLTATASDADPGEGGTPGES